MTDEARSKWSGASVSDWIGFLPHDLSDTGVGLAQVVETGRHTFGLEGVALIEFVRRSLYTLLAHGAQVRHWGKPGDPHRNIVLRYGENTDREIVEGIIADWLAGGAGNLEWGDFWFAQPETFQEK